MTTKANAMTRHPIIELLEEIRQDKGLSRYQFAVNVLRIHDETYRNWVKKFPTKLENKKKESLCKVLNLTIDELNKLL